MTPERCSLAVRDCTSEADYRLVLDPPESEFDRLVRTACHEHLGWYRKTYVKERGYEMEVIPLTPRGARRQA